MKPSTKVSLFLCALLFLQMTAALEIINQILRKKIENFRLQMPCGINGGPPLAPYKEALINVHLEEDAIE